MYKNIVYNPAILNGKPIIKGTRISVELVMEWLSTGGSTESIAEKHPLLTQELVMEAIAYAARFSKNEIIIELQAAA
jgi:uncharacterized protein (DUF433 family)